MPRLSAGFLSLPGKTQRPCGDHQPTDDESDPADRDRIHEEPLPRSHPNIEETGE